MIDGKKTSCWMWYMFPQYYRDNLSGTAKQFSISNIYHAMIYLSNKTLRDHLYELNYYVYQNLLKGKNLYNIVCTDNVKFISSLVLFKIASKLINDIKLYELYIKIDSNLNTTESDNHTITQIKKDIPNLDDLLAI